MLIGSHLSTVVLVSLGFFTLWTLVQIVVDATLGVKERVRDLPRWRQIVHELMYMLYGASIYWLFIAK